MKSLFKGLFGLLALALALFIVVVAALTLLLNPNDFKQELSTLAAKQGVLLNIEGDIAWKFFPNLGLSASKVSVYSHIQTDKTLAEIEHLTASVQFMPLIKKQVRINGIHLTKPHISLSVNEQGQGNWLSTPQAEGEANVHNPAGIGIEKSSSALEFAMKNFSISGATLSYSDKTSNQKIFLSSINLSSQDINVSEQAFPIDVQMNAVDSNFPNPIEFRWHSELTLNNTLSKVTLVSGLLDLQSNGATLNLKLSANAEHKKRWLYTANYELSRLNIKRWLHALGFEVPQTNNNKALTLLSISGNANSASQSSKLNNLVLVLDSTTFKGNIEISHNQDMPHAINLTGDNLLADDYFAPENKIMASRKDGLPSQNARSTKPETKEQILPLEFLRSLNFNANISLQTLQAMNLEYSALDLVASGNKGIVKIDNLHADFYQGSIDTQAILNVIGEKAHIEQNVTLDGIQIKALVQALASPHDAPKSENSLSGLINAQLSASSKGVSTNVLLNSVVGKILFNTENLQLTPLNLEQEFCQAIESLSPTERASAPNSGSEIPQEKSVAKEWPALTELRNVNGLMDFSQQKLIIQNISAGVENILIGTRGFADLKENYYSMQIPMTLNTELSSDQGCKIKSAFIQNRELSLVKCEGTLAPFDTAQACGLDKREFRGLLKDLAKYKARKKLNTKKDRLLKKANEKFGEGTADLLKELLKR